MSVGQQNRLLFMTDILSRKAIAREANISLYKLRLLERQGRSLGGNELNRFVNLSRRISYQDLRIRGFNITQARRFRSQSIVNLKSTHQRMEKIQEYLTDGVFASMKVSRDRQGIGYDEDLLWSEAQDSLFKGLQRSKKTIEDWENY